MLRTHTDNDSVPTEDSKDSKQNSESYRSQAYRFFSSMIYSRLSKVDTYRSFAELKGEDPLFGQIYNACRKDGRGIHHIIASAAELALSKEEYGASCYWYFGPEKSNLSQFAMLMIDPRDIEWLFKAKIVEYSDGSGSFAKIFGKNNIFSMKLGTQEWRDERNRHLKVLDGKVIGNDLPKMEKILQNFLDKINFENNKGMITNLEKFASDYTLEVVAKTKLGVTHLASETKDQISSMISKVSVELANQTNTFIKAIFPFLDYFPFYYFFTDELKNLLKIGDVILKEQVIGPNKESILERDSFITLGRDKKTMRLDSAEILNKFKEFLVVGHETTAKLLLLTLMLLGDVQHREILQKLRHELQQFKTTSPREWAKEDFDQMIYLSAVVHEALRLYPPVPIMVNKINKACQFKDRKLVPGDLVFISQKQTHRYKPAWGMDAEEFNPARFIDSSGKLKEFSDYMFFPFGFNPRKCVGQKFALLEVKQLIAILVSEYDLTLGNDLHHPFPVESTFTMKIPMENIPLYFEKKEEMKKEIKFKSQSF